MDTALRTFYTNFLEYSVTGEPKYKTAYLAAQQNIEATIASQPAKQSAPLKHKHDATKSINMRTIGSPTPSQSLTAYYLTAGVLGAVAIGLSLI